jgi:hypothetical protein
MKLYAVCISSYQSHEPEVCDCFISLVFAENSIEATIKGRRICEERYSYLNGWDEAGGIQIEPLEQGMQVGECTLNYSIKTKSESHDDTSVIPTTPSIYATAVSSHYWWGQDEYAECLLSFITAKDISEAKKIGAERKDRLFAMADGDWADSYAVAALKLEDIIEVENRYIRWKISRV